MFFFLIIIGSVFFDFGLFFGTVAFYGFIFFLDGSFGGFRSFRCFGNFRSFGELGSFLVADGLLFSFFLGSGSCGLFLGSGFTGSLLVGYLLLGGFFTGSFFGGSLLLGFRFLLGFFLGGLVLCGGRCCVVLHLGHDRFTVRGNRDRELAGSAALLCAEHEPVAS